MPVLLIILTIVFLILLIIGIFAIYSSNQVNFPFRPTYVQAYRSEWKNNIPMEFVKLNRKELVIRSKLGYDMVARQYDWNDNSHRYLILLHGYSSTSITCDKYVPLFESKGINCLAPDLRYFGKTGGKGSTFGFYESCDIEQWIQEIYNLDSKAEIGLFGISLGAATTILTAAKRNDIKYVISYCSFSSYKKITFDKGLLVYPKIFKMLYPLLLLGGYMRTKARMDLIDIKEAIARITCPILLLHSHHDEYTDFKHAQLLKEGNPNAILKTFDHIGHAKAFSKYPIIYKRYIDDFMDGLKDF